MNFEPALLSEREDALRSEVKSFLDGLRQFLNNASAIILGCQHAMGP